MDIKFLLRSIPRSMVSVCGVPIAMPTSAKLMFYMFVLKMKKVIFFVIFLLRCYRQPIDGLVWQRRGRKSGSLGHNQNNISCFGATFLQFQFRL